jgi:hypothetical protein
VATDIATLELDAVELLPTCLSVHREDEPRNVAHIGTPSDSVRREAETPPYEHDQSPCIPAKVATAAGRNGSPGASRP